MKFLSRFLGMSAILSAAFIAGCSIVSDDPAEPTDEASSSELACCSTGDLVSEATPSCCEIGSLRNPLLGAEGQVSTDAIPEFGDKDYEGEPLPRPDLPKDQGKFTPLTKAGHLQLQIHPETGKPWRVWFEGEVCLRYGALEVFVCKKGTKEHEAILASDLDGRMIHTALVALGAKPGQTARWVPEYTPPTGQKINVSVYYLPKEGGEPILLPAHEWIRDTRTKKAMSSDWVFAGSRLVKDPDAPADQEPYYTANNGEFISLSNFADSMLDVPKKSTSEDDQLLYESYVKRIPPLGSKVWVMLEPVKADESKKE